MKKQYQAVTAVEAVKVIKSGDHVHISSVSNVPQCLVKALCDRGRAGELKNVYIHHLHTEGAAPYVNPEFEGIFQHNAFFVGANVRESVQKGLADYIPVFLGETSKLYRERYIKCNVAMIQVSPPDKFGYVSLGSSVDATLAAMECAEFTIAVVNRHVPRSLGDSQIHIGRINYVVEDDTPLLTVEAPAPTKVVIGKSPLFMSLIILGYIFGIIHKSQYSNDIVIWLYVFNAALVSIDLSLYCFYIGRNRRELMNEESQK